MSYEFGDVVLVPFPFTNQAASKKRPAVIVSSKACNRAKPDVVVMAITSQLRPSPALGEVWIGQWPAAGLIKPSSIKPVFATLEQAMIIRQCCRQRHHRFANRHSTGLFRDRRRRRYRVTMSLQIYRGRRA